MLPYLNKRQTRLYLSNEALSYGWGGITLVSKLSGKSQKIIQFKEKWVNVLLIFAAFQERCSLHRKHAGNKCHRASLLH